MNPWVMLGVCAVWLASLWGVGSWQRDEGRTAERLAWQERDSAQLRAANATIERLTGEARRTEAAHQTRLADIGANIVMEGVRHAENTRRAVAGARALVLRQPACPDAAGERAAGPPLAGAAGADGPPACELPEPAVRDFFQLVLDADRDVRLLGHAREVIEEDRRVCGIQNDKEIP